MKEYELLLRKYLDYQEKHPFDGAPDELYDPANYILGLGGKRIRPLLALIGFQMIDTNVDRALPLAHIVEVFHNFTLVHDDIMDQADVRRGEPTVHKKWDSNIAILSGDMMLVKAYSYLTELDTSDEIRNSIIRSFSLMAEEVCVGQQFDMNFEKAEQVGEEEYLEMIKLKTSVLLAWSLQSGAVLAGADSSTTNELYIAGINLGLAFQVMDDYLDTFGDAKKFGKRIGGDILENKKTLLWIEAQRRADDKQLSELKNWYSTTTQSQEKIDRVTTMFKELGVDRYASEKMDAYFKSFEENMNRLRPSCSVEVLEKLAADLRFRQS